MLARKLTSLSAILFTLLLLACARPAHPQTFDLEQDRVQMAPLDGLFRFHTGDDPRWSSPSFDDSTWPLLRSDTNWSDQGYKEYAGFAWYRFRVLLPAQHPPLALYIENIYTSYQVFAGGQFIGQTGGLPPHPKVLYTGRQIFSLPTPQSGTPPSSTPPSTTPQSLSIAIRVWHYPGWANYYPGGLQESPRIGDARLLNNWRSLLVREVWWSYSAINLVLLINILAGLAGLALFALRPAEHEYLWFGAWQLMDGLQTIQQDVGSFLPNRMTTYDALQDLLVVASMFCLLEFIVTLLRARRSRAWWIAIACILFDTALILPRELHWIGIAHKNLAVSIALLPYMFSVLIFLIQGLRRRHPDAPLLFVPLTLYCAAGCLGNILWAGYTSGFFHTDYYDGWYSNLTDRPFPISVGNLADFLVQISILAILVLRFSRTRRDEQRLTAELESARAVQHVLIPDEIPSIPGFRIQCVYKPAGEVGGDFFQIVPLPGGSALIAIGDVSGKGMPAAMTVSLLVGTLRTLAHYTENPSAVLAAMNQRMIGRADGGFTTCLVLRIDPDGAFTLANAGHLAPYIQGKELAVEFGLSLGLAADSTYPETAFRLAEDAQLTLVTDGVVEARGKTRELFGFDRTAAIASNSAESIALAAQQFGQNDDITVVTLTRQPITEPSTIDVTTPALSPA